MRRPAPAVLAEDLRALAEVVPFDATTTEVLETAADRLEELAAVAEHAWVYVADEVADDPTVVEPECALHDLYVAVSGLRGAPVVQGPDCAHTVLRDGAETVYRCDLPPGHEGVHQQSGGPVWNDARELL